MKINKVFEDGVRKKPTGHTPPLFENICDYNNRELQYDIQSCRMPLPSLPVFITLQSQYPSIPIGFSSRSSKNKICYPLLRLSSRPIPDPMTQSKVDFRRDGRRLDVSRYPESWGIVVEGNFSVPLS
jgi:hypothetical protein